MTKARQIEYSWEKDGLIWVEMYLTLGIWLNSFRTSRKKQVKLNFLVHDFWLIWGWPLVVGAVKIKELCPCCVYAACARMEIMRRLLMFRYCCCWPKAQSPRVTRQQKQQRQQHQPQLEQQELCCCCHCCLWGNCQVARISLAYVFVSRIYP